jgi:tRNA(Arg) A34 adenosine deaminase TadA
MDATLSKLAPARPHADAWADLEAPWQLSLELAWRSYAGGTIPIGAALVNGEGELVAEGRNRVYERTAPQPWIARSLLAHAEVNALVGLDPDRRYLDHVLYTSLEPCLLCLGAAVMATVGTVRYAGVDPVAGGDGFYREGERSRRPHIEIEGPRTDRFGSFASALVLAFFLRRRPEGRVVLAFDQQFPALRQAAEEILGVGVPGYASLSAFHAALAAAWPVLPG